MAGWPPHDPLMPMGGDDDERVLMDLWWRRARIFRADIEAEIARIVDERGWAMSPEEEAEPADHDEDDG